MIATVPALLTVCFVCAADDPRRSNDALLQVYQERCRRESAALIERLDRLDDELQRLVPVREDESLIVAVETSWARGREARDLFRDLSRCAAKYDGWARSAGLPATFSVLGGGALPRWEALRPLLLPLLGAEKAGWQEPRGDDASWKAKPAGRLYEWLIVLRWEALGAPDVAEIDRAWFERETGAAFVKAAASVAGAPRYDLHGQYRFDVLPTLAPSGEPFRVVAVAARLNWRIGSQATAFGSFVLGKDALMRSLFAIVSEGGDGAAIDWFSAGGRCFPPFTALQPELDQATGAARMIMARNGDEIEARLGKIRLRPDGEEVGRRVRDSIYWYQVGAMTPDGRWRPPEIGWSGGIPAGTAIAPEPTEEPVASNNRVATASGATTSCESCWAAVCRWAADEVASAAGSPRPSARRATVENRSNWSLAFGADELAEVLESRSGGVWRISRRLGPWREPAECRIVVSRVTPGSSIDVELWSTSARIAARTFRVRGEWPSWFALPVVPYRNRLPIVALTLGSATIWLTRVVRRSGREGWPRALVSTDVLFLASGLALGAQPIACGAPVPRPSASRGDRVVFYLPAGAAVPAPLRVFAAEACAACCRELARLDADDGQGPILEIRAAIQAEGSRSSLVATRFAGDATAEAIAQDLAAFKVPEEAEPALPAPLLGRASEGDIGLVAAIHDGDHGGLIPPSGRPVAGQPPILSLWVASVSRDRTPGRGLDARSRLASMEERSRAIVPAASSVEPRTFDRLDEPADRPRDLVAVRRRQWEGATVDRPDLADQIRRFAELAPKLYSERRSSLSRTTLGRPWGLAEWVWGLSLTSWVGAILWIASPGLTSRSWRLIVVRLAWSVASGMAGIGLLALTVVSGQRPLGLDPRQSGMLAGGALVGSAVVFLLLMSAAWTRERLKPSGYNRLIGKRHLDSLFEPPDPPVRSAKPATAIGWLLIGSSLMFWLAVPDGLTDPTAALWLGASAWCVGAGLVMEGLPRAAGPAGGAHAA